MTVNECLSCTVIKHFLLCPNDILLVDFILCHYTIMIDHHHLTCSDKDFKSYNTSEIKCNWLLCLMSKCN